MRFISFLLTFVPFAFSLCASDWPGWRGSNGLGLSDEKHLPTHWSKDKNIAWKVSLPGKGASSPAIVGDRVYITAQTPDTALHILAIDLAGGEILWDREVGRGKLKANNLHNMATPTPAADAQKVYVMFGTGDLAALDRDGKILWQRNLVTEYGKYNFNHGYGSSPMLLNGLLYIACMHQGPSYILAVDANTGKNTWKKDRHFESKDEGQDSYSSPIFAKAGLRTQLVIAGAEALNAYDPATGEELWRLGGLKVPHPAGRTIAGPTADESTIVVVGSGFQNRGYMTAVSTGAHGTLSDKNRLWTFSKFAPDCPTPVMFNGNVFCIRDDGMASCLDLKSGEPKWQERLFSENVKVSPVAADDKIYFTSNQANSVVVKAESKLQILATNKLDEATLATPAISDGKLFIRTDSHLYCVTK